MGDSHSSSSTSSDFYVGYLPTPGRHRRFLKIVVPLLVLAFAALAAVIATGQRDPGTTTVEVNESGHWKGTLFTSPYPMLVTDDGKSNLLIGMGKFGAFRQYENLTEDFDGKRCLVEGRRLSRGGRSMIELIMEDSAIRADHAEDAAPPALQPESSGTPTAVRLVGEILDGKCFVGGMKPGDGKGHKACAILCLRGGIPALFAAADPAQLDELPLLRIDGGTELPEEVLELVGEPVVIEGELHTIGTLPVLDTSPDKIQRWSGPPSGAAGP